MTWEEAVISARNSEELQETIHHAYLDKDLLQNVQRYSKSEEFDHLKQLIEDSVSLKNLKILEIGSGNGILAASLSLEGCSVTALEPDPSSEVGTGAIQYIKDKYQLSNLKIVASFAENYEHHDELFDLIIARQAMHHANNLEQFVSNTARFLKKGGLYITIRDHVIYSENDKKTFLKSHPLHKYYGGENAFTRQEYVAAFKSGGLSLIKELKYYDSVINYAPLPIDGPQKNVEKELKNIKNKLTKKFGFLGRLKIFEKAYCFVFRYPEKLLDEKYIHGRMYSFILRKT